MSFIAVRPYLLNDWDLSVSRYVQCWGERMLTSEGRGQTGYLKQRDRPKGTVKGIALAIDRTNDR